LRQGGGRRKGWREGIADEEVSLCSRRFRSDGGERIGLGSHVGCTAVLEARDPLEVEAVRLLQERREEEDDGRWAERKKGVEELRRRSSVHFIFLASLRKKRSHVLPMVDPEVVFCSETGEEARTRRGSGSDSRKPGILLVCLSSRLANA